jgi:hypothetical protein
MYTLLRNNPQPTQLQMESAFEGGNYFLKNPLNLANFYGAR